MGDDLAHRLFRQTGSLGQHREPGAIPVDEAKDAAVPRPYLRVTLVHQPPVQLLDRQLLHIREQRRQRPGRGMDAPVVRHS